MGNLIKVRVVEQGGIFDEVTVPENSTVMEVLRKANARTDTQKTIRVNDEDATLDTIVPGGATVFVVPQTTGN